MVNILIILWTINDVVEQKCINYNFDFLSSQKNLKKKVDFVLLNVMIYYITNLIREIRNSTFL